MKTNSWIGIKKEKILLIDTISCPALSVICTENYTNYIIRKLAPRSSKIFTSRGSYRHVIGKRTINFKEIFHLPKSNLSKFVQT